MTRLAACLMSLTLIATVRAAPAVPDLSGAWTLNRAASDLPTEAGFDPDYHDSTGSTSGGRSGGSGGGRGGRGGGGGGGSTGIGSGAISTKFESPEDSQKIKELVAEVTHPPQTLTIAQSATAITITDPEGKSRTFRINGKEETIRLDAGPIGVVTKWEGAQLVIHYVVEKDRELRVGLSRAADARRLTVTSQFAERGRGETIKRVYE
jgi:hypothetical protein